MSTSSAQPLSKTHIAFRIVLAVVALIGTGLAVHLSMAVRPLETEYQRLSLEVGSLPIQDPRKVYVVAIPSKEKYVWRYRIYVPANYQGRQLYSVGPISATTPRHQVASSGWSTFGPSSEPVDYLMTVALVEENGNWYCDTNTHNGRGRASLDRRLIEIIKKSSTLVIETSGQFTTNEFGVDQPICLLRVRSPEPCADPNTEDPLYIGFYYYLVPQSALGTFEAAQAASSRPAGAVP